MTTATTYRVSFSVTDFYVQDIRATSPRAAIAKARKLYADQFEEAAKAAKNPKRVANLVQGELMGRLKAKGLEIEKSPISMKGVAMSADLNEAFRQATLNVIDFLSLRAGLSRLDAYSLASIAVHFRVTQFVNGNRGIHAMVPRSVLAELKKRPAFLE